MNCEELALLASELQFSLVKLALLCTLPNLLLVQGLNLFVYFVHVLLSLL